MCVTFEKNVFGRWVLTPADTRAARVHQPERKLSTVSPHPRAHPSSPTATGTRPLPKLGVLVKACLCAFLVGRTMPWVLRPCARGLWLPGGVPAPNPTAPARPRAPDLGRELPGAGTSLASLHIPGYSCGMAHSQCLKNALWGDMDASGVGAGGRPSLACARTRRLRTKGVFLGCRNSPWIRGFISGLGGSFPHPGTQNSGRRGRGGSSRPFSALGTSDASASSRVSGAGLQPTPAASAHGRKGCGGSDSPPPPVTLTLFFFVN